LGHLGRFTKTPYLVLFIILGAVGVSVASASITITNVQTPTEPQDAATKEYVDTTAILPPSTQTQIDNIETETNKIQMVKDDVGMIKDNQYTLFKVRGPSALNTCDAAGGSADTDRVLVHSYNFYHSFNRS